MSPVELQTKVPEDYTKFYNHRVGPILGPTIGPSPGRKCLPALSHLDTIKTLNYNKPYSRGLLFDCKTSCKLRKPSFEALVPLLMVTGHVVTQPTLMTVAAGESSKMCRYVTLSHPWPIELVTNLREI